MRAGELVRTRMLAATLLVRRDAVAILVRSGPVEVRNAGEALEAGREGQVLRVRNSATGRVIRARVLGEGMVEPVQVDTPSAP
jgi:flagella basal body P-ring formation protein FlgA